MPLDLEVSEGSFTEVLVKRAEKQVDSEKENEDTL